MRILVVEDEQDLNRILAKTLTAEGYSVDACFDGVEALDYLEDYIHHVDGSRPLHPREYMRRYQYSTLPYFHDVMKI